MTFRPYGNLQHALLKVVSCGFRDVFIIIILSPKPLYFHLQLLFFFTCCVMFLSRI